MWLCFARFEPSEQRFAVNWFSAGVYSGAFVISLAFKRGKHPKQVELTWLPLAMKCTAGIFGSLLLAFWGSYLVFLVFIVSYFYCFCTSHTAISFCLIPHCFSGNPILSSSLSLLICCCSFTCFLLLPAVLFKWVWNARNHYWSRSRKSRSLRNSFSLSNKCQSSQLCSCCYQHSRCL